MDSRYKEALERCKKEFDFNNLAYSHEEIRQRLERVFPELRESEDEMIRKALIQNLKERFGTKGNMGKGLYMPDVLAWFEKRGEQTIITDVLIKAGLKPYKDGGKWCVLVGDNIQDGVCGFGDTIDEALFEFLNELTEISKKSQGKSPLEVWKDMRLEVYQQASGNRHEPNCSDDITKMFSLTDIDEIFEKVVENQDEHKSADDVKPKFKVGDWIVYNDNLYHIGNIGLQKYYDCLRVDATVHVFSFLDIDSKSHLWTIRDAKYGDVLFTSSTASHEIFLFKELDRNNNIKCLCSYDSESGFCEGKYHFIGKPSFNTHPATKEQRDLLFQKMREAGYGRDSKNKELKKIEQEPTVEPKFNVGDWVRAISSGNIFKIISINDGLYRVLCHDGVESNYPIIDVAKDLEYWTIQDANDGDVLVTESGRPFIFKGCLDEKHPDSPVSYCGIDSTNHFYNYKGSAWWTDENVYPATKEQRDLLFQKMHEAGYEWDAENKKLITIEQNPVRPVCYNNMDDLIADAMINEINESNLPESSKHNRIFWIKSHRQKRDWSAEDEHTLEAIIKEIEANKAACPEYDEKAYDMFLSWLKSIKERMKGE